MVDLFLILFEQQVGIDLGPHALAGRPLLELIPLRRIDDPCLPVIGELNIDTSPEFFLESFGVDRKRDLEPAVHIPDHPIGGGKVASFLPAVIKEIDSPMFKKTIDDADDADILAELFD